MNDLSHLYGPKNGTQAAAVESKRSGSRKLSSLIVTTIFGVLLLTLTPIALLKNCAAGASPDQNGSVDPHEFLEIMRKLADIRDFRDQEKVARLLGISLKERRYGRSLWFLAAKHPSWIGDFNYSLSGDPPGSEQQNISIIISQPPCVTPGDIQAEFGQPNLPSSGIPTAPSFIDEKAAHAYLEEIEHGPGVVSMNYRLRENPGTTLSFYFAFRRCLQSAGVSMRLQP